MNRKRENGILFSHDKEGNLAICNKMDEPRGHHAKQNEPDRKRQIFYDLTYMCNPKKKVKLIETESRE